ncbi:protein of unknown function DUF885 [alpha proteobacterium U9-1i]|nr:protein of unknown function DUF885 [alpha proteobacterium U9-1i]
MQLSRRQALVSASAFALVGCATATDSPPAEGGDINAFFEAAFDEGVARSPELATSLGDRRGYDRWNDETETFAEATLRRRVALRDEMRARWNVANLSASDALSYRLFDQGVTRAEQGWRWRNHRYVFNHFGGAQANLPAFLINQHQVTNVADAEAYVARLNGIRGKLDQQIANAEHSASLGIQPPKFSYEGVLSSSRNVIAGAPFADGADSPLFADFKTKVNRLEIAQTEKDRLIAAGRTAMLSSVKPAYENLIAVMTQHEARATTDDGAWKLPDGDEFYADRLRNFTTTERSADEIHNIGLENVARLHGEMRTIMRQVNFRGDLNAFFEFMETDPRFYVADTAAGRADYVRQATAVIDAMRDRLPQYFGRLPRAPMEVRPVEPFRERSAGLAFYSGPAADGSRPGVYYVNTFDVKAIPTYQIEALAYHEGIPGHHMQIAIAQELESVPRFRRFGGYTAYSEGWGLYTERLGKEMGAYQDPYSDFGRLTMELRRAIRLVVDTGVHSKRWTRRQAVDYILANQPGDEASAMRDMGRYIVMPGQATAYMIGQMEILRLREEARTSMGARYSISGFHDAVLANGAVPLDILGELVREWSSAAPS